MTEWESWRSISTRAEERDAFGHPFRKIWMNWEKVKMQVIDTFAKVSDHMAEGMMHGQMADHCNFLGLGGFARPHEYHFMCETISMRRIHRYSIDHRNRLLPVANTQHPDVIPVAWSNFTRQAVESETKSKAVETGMHMRCEWEHDSKELYVKSAKDLYDAEGIAAAGLTCEPVRDVDDECEYADRLALELDAVDYDMQVIAPMRHEPHEKYRKKPHGVGKKLSWG